MNEKILEIARECNAYFPYPLGEKYGPQVVLIPIDFERFALRMKQEALLEAAEVFETIGYSKFKHPHEELRRMAEQLGKGE